MNRKPFLIVAAIVLLLIAVRVGVGMMNRPDDQKLVREALQQAILASKEGRPGGVLDKLSDRLQVNNMEPGTRSQIADFIRRNRPEVSVMNQNAVVTGEEARIVSPVRIQVEFLGQKMDRTMRDVTLTFRKEEAMQYLFIPTRKWRLAEVDAPQDAVQEFLSLG